MRLASFDEHEHYQQLAGWVKKFIWVDLLECNINEAKV